MAKFFAVIRLEKQTGVAWSGWVNSSSLVAARTAAVAQYQGSRSMTYGGGKMIVAALPEAECNETPDMSPEFRESRMLLAE